MDVTRIGLMCAIGAVLLAGCSTPTGRCDAGTAAPCPDAATPVADGQASEMPVMVAPKPGTFCVITSTNGVDVAFAEQVRSAVSERASVRGYQLAEPDTAAVEIRLSASAKEKARLDDWFVMDGEAKVCLRVWVTDDYRCFEQSFAVEGERRLSKDAAAKVMVAPLADKVFDWVEKTARKGTENE